MSLHQTSRAVLVPALQVDPIYSVQFSNHTGEKGVTFLWGPISFFMGNPLMVSLSLSCYKILSPSDTWPNLSSHPKQIMTCVGMTEIAGYPGFKGARFDGDHLRSLIDGLEENGLMKGYTHLLSGTNKHTQTN